MNNVLAHHRAKSLSIREGTDGEASALDYLNMALQSADITGHSAFKNKSLRERYQLTTDQIALMMSVLSGPAKETPASKKFLDRLKDLKEWVDLEIKTIDSRP
jgi:hypothetical protein